MARMPHPELDMLCSSTYTFTGTVVPSFLCTSIFDRSLAYLPKMTVGNCTRLLEVNRDSAVLTPDSLDAR